MDGTADARAARNNAEWCAAIWRSHGLAHEQVEGVWICPQEVPRFYPNAVTVEPDADPRRQVAVIAALSAGLEGRALGVKDSFRRLDLAGLGLRPLFDARWIHRPASAASTDADDDLDWRPVRDPVRLAAWEGAWQGDSSGGPAVFPEALLLDRRVLVLGGFRGGAIAAGGIVFDAAGVLGVSNLFGSLRGFLAALARLRPRQDLAGYERGAALSSAAQAGFLPGGALRVWSRPAMLP
jgi:hypothetical protein